MSDILNLLSVCSHYIDWERYGLVVFGGLVFSVVSIFFLFKSKPEYKKTMAKIISREPHPNAFLTTLNLEFKDAQGNLVNAPLMMTKKHAFQHTGDEIEILYNPATGKPVSDNKNQRIIYILPLLGILPFLAVLSDCVIELRGDENTGYILFGIASLIALLFWLKGLWDSMQFFKNALPADAIILDIFRRRGFMSSETNLNISFKDRLGNLIRTSVDHKHIILFSFSRPFSWGLLHIPLYKLRAKEGDVIKIAYDPKSPENVRIRGFGQLYQHHIFIYALIIAWIYVLFFMK